MSTCLEVSSSGNILVVGDAGGGLHQFVANDGMPFNKYPTDEPGTWGPVHFFASSKVLPYLCLPPYTHTHTPTHPVTI
jgi:hypothetical protein